MSNRKTRKKIFIIILLITIFVLGILFEIYIIPNFRYNSAMKLYNSEEYAKAYDAFNSLEYKNSRAMAKKALYKKQIKKLSSAKVGETVFFGAYEQDNDTSNGREEIEWYVLYKKDGKALILSKYVIECKEYTDKYDDITWKASTIRKWLDETFFIKAFDPQYEKNILKREIYESDPNQAGETADRIFLLSENEVLKYIKKDEISKGVPTAYAIANGVNVYDEFSSKGTQTSYWWLRSYKNDNNYVSAVHPDGSIFYLGDCVGYINGGVRPAMWIKTK